MRVLVTGATGFVGRYFIDELLSNGFAGSDIIALSNESNSKPIVSGNQEIPVRVVDITDRDALRSLFSDTRPDAVVHLAAISHVVDAQNEREILVDTNVVGTQNVCAAAAMLKHQVVFLYASSSLVYGGSTKDAAYDEQSLPGPESVYGASKLSGEFALKCYEGTNIKPYIVRPFNHIGPGQAPNFVCSGLARKVAKAEDGGTIPVGNLKAFRDFTDVRDIVTAYRLILTQCPEENLFVLGSGEDYCIEDILARFIKLSGKNIDAQVDSSLLRDVDPPKLRADARLAKKVLGWQPKININDTLREIYEFESTRP